MQHARPPLAAVLFIIALAAAPLYAQTHAQETPFDFYARGPYRANVPRPQSILRFDTGEFHTNYAQMERVLGEIAAAAPDRMRITDIGDTNEFRTMHLAVLSAPENMRRLDAIKANLRRLSDPRGLSQQEAGRMINETPLVVWLSYAIHGNESAAFETMMQVVYQLAASEEPQTLEVLRNCVVLVATGVNPDGHERFVTWYNSVATGDANPAAFEHREPWSVQGRFNRYRFDLNRDNIASTQRETQNMQRAYREWNPQVYVDHHGQPSQYFFPPAALPVNPNLPTAQTERWLSAFGRANAREFDARGWVYYTRDVFDLFYPGYWDSFPALNGATGMTYETDGGGFKGLRFRREDESIVTLRSAIAKHYVASLATLETAAQNARARLNDYYEFKRTAIEEGERERTRRFVFLPGTDRGRAAEIARILLRAGIEVRQASAPFRSRRAHSFTDNEVRERDFPVGAYVVDLAQPQKRLAKALLEPNTELDPAFVREQVARFRRNERRGANAPREEYGFYDITAWSLPLAFGVEAYWTEDADRIAASPLDQNTDSQNTNPPGGATGRASVAYIIPYTSDAAAALIARLLQEDFRLAVSTRTLAAEGRDYPRGTIVVRVGRNPVEVHNRIAELARETGVNVFAVNSGFIESGDTGIGSETVVPVRRPRLIVIADEAVNQTSYGAMWWTLDRFHIEFTPMTIAALRRARLDDYNAIIMPDGSPSAYFAALGKPGVDLLRGWCERGGTLVTVKGASVFAALKDVNLTSARLVGSADDEDGKDSSGAQAGAAQTGAAQIGAGQAKPTPEATPAATAGGSSETSAAQAARRTSRAAVEQGQTGSEKQEGAAPVLPVIASPSARPGRVPEPVPGAIFRATVDRTTPLTYGYEQPMLPVLMDSAYFFRPSKEGTNAVVFRDDGNTPLRIAGFVWEGNTERLLRGTTYVFEEPLGRGRVVLFAEDPNYRGIFRATTRLFFNSFLFQFAD